ncbi:MAG: DMT family transporter, partial [Erysipelotrichaceae bacterium]|nr:DMT family transporter [Erysipelotrichaceae bacterium]
MKTKHKSAVFMAVFAAALYALNAPVSKLLLLSVPSVMMAAFLYLGAGLGILGVKTLQKSSKEESLQKKDLPFVIGMVVLDIAAPICMMTGLKTASAANASLLGNFEIAATALIALIFFKEKISKKLWTAIVLVTIACMLLSIQDEGSFQFSSGSILVL